MRPLNLALATTLLVANLAASPRAWPATPCGQPVAPIQSVAPMLYLTSVDDARSLEVSQGSQIQLTLSENASTGYRWSLASLDPTLLELVSELPQTSPSDTCQALAQPQPVGSPGQVVYVFKALRPGLTKLTLKNWRSWEGDGSIIDRFQVSLHIHAKSGSQGGVQPNLPARSDAPTK